jgi:[acyl-carrier-protein] S-malonyltransferase
VAPGQGAQTPGFLTPWLDLDGARDRLDWLGTVAGIDLVRHGTESDADTIRDTAVAQPLLVAAGLVALPAVLPDRAQAAPAVAAFAGHSVGEITAAAAVGVLDPEAAMVFVRERGNAMAAAAATTPTGMTAVLGGDRDEVLAAIAAAGLTPANDNGAGQIVAAGTLEQLAAFAAAPPERARLRPLQVAGAFHTEHMAPAVETLARHARSITRRRPVAALLSNRDGAAVADGDEVLARLVSQVRSPVRWDLVMATLADLGVTGVLELPPAGTLTGLVKRAIPGVQTVALKTPDDLAAAAELVRQHGGTDAG